MKRKFALDIKKLNEILGNPELEKEFQKVFCFVETITGQQYNPNLLTQKDIEIWNQKFDEVLKRLLK